MRHAGILDLQSIYRHFQSRRDVFPHIRQDGLKRRIEAHQCIYQDGVVITYQQYRKRTRVGDVNVPAGAIMLHQILNSKRGNGAGQKVFQQFVRKIVKPFGGDLYLSVRKANTVACQFYERNSMTVEGTVEWKNRTIPGRVYRLTQNFPQRSV